MDVKSVIERLRNDEDYYGDFGKQFISNSDIKTLITEPDLFKKQQVETVDMVKGRYFHTAVLEPHKVADNFPIVTCSTRNTNIYKDFVKANSEEGVNPPPIFLTHKEKEDLDYLVQALYAKDDIYNLIKNADAYEEPSIGKIEGLWFKGKGDIVSRGAGFVDDLKTTSDIGKFSSSVLRYYYDSSAFIYREIFDLDVRFIVIDKSTKRIGVYYVSEETYARGRERVMRGLEQYHKYYGENPTHDVTQYYHVDTV